MKSIFYVVICGFVLALAPVGAEAYKSTKQTATRVNDTTVLYTIDYDFGFLNADVWLPIVSRRDANTSTSTTLLTYELRTPSVTYTEGTAYSLVLSKAAIQNNRYYIPKGERAKFSLVTLLKNPIGNTVAGDSVSLQVTSLMHALRTDDKTFLRNLDSETLKAYVTPAVVIPKVALAPAPSMPAITATPGK